jgi:hypothetical protein
MTSKYVKLRARSTFSFLEGASTPEGCFSRPSNRVADLYSNHVRFVGDLTLDNYPTLSLV